ncbi:39S ribosomal protein L10, mitochondrial-like [Acanthaster planci]|uniref:Large ribosomal subunit protein uL10m n=1 Tax=Acanthaster planci TaxID=133434 RepID=A0A8B7XGG7_ACAPL|nr:39S ribosomal protein L10, mitochondrial-like [Acanthaster planci]
MLCSRMASGAFCKCSKLRVSVWLPSLTSVRSMKSVNTRTPRPMHITRAKLMELTKYKKPKDNRPLAEQCSMRYKPKAETKPPPVEVFMANQCREQMLSQSLIAAFHNEGLTAEEMSIIRRRLRKVGITVKMYNNKVMRMALLGTRLENMSPLLVGQNVYAVSDKPLVKELLKATKKIPKIHLLGGLVENRLMSAKQMAEFSQLPEKRVLQGELAGILSQSVGSTYSLLQRHQQTLVTNLSQWIKQRQETSI